MGRRPAIRRAVAGIPLQSMDKGTGYKVELRITINQDGLLCIQGLDDENHQVTETREPFPVNHHHEAAGYLQEVLNQLLRHWRSRYA